MQLSQHAKIRCQQRGIVPFMVDLLYQFGSSLPAGDGTEKLYFDKHGRKKVETYTGGLIKAKAVFVKQVVRFLMQLIRHFSLTRYSPSMGLARPL